MRTHGINTLLQAEWLMLILSDGDPTRNLEDDAAKLGCSRQALHTIKHALEKLGLLKSWMPAAGGDLRRRVIQPDVKLVQKIDQWKTSPQN